jgi:hypothetical protein
MVGPRAVGLRVTARMQAVTEGTWPPIVSASSLSCDLQYPALCPSLSIPCPSRRPHQVLQPINHSLSFSCVLTLQPCPNIDTDTLFQDSLCCVVRSFNLSSADLITLLSTSSLDILWSRCVRLLLSPSPACSARLTPSGVWSVLAVLASPVLILWSALARLPLMLTPFMDHLVSHILR